MTPEGITISRGFVYRDGIEYFLTNQEIKTITTKAFHLWPYELKRLLPQYRSCAMCIKRPIDFRYDERRIAPAREQGLPPHRCPNWSWSRAAPFYRNDLCGKGCWK